MPRLASLIAGLVMSLSGCATPHLDSIRAIPLASGLEEAKSPEVSEAGGLRTVRIRADGHAEFATVRDFYLAALSKAGWTPEPLAKPMSGVLAFRKGDEQLRISIEPAAGVGNPLGVVFEHSAPVAPADLSD